MAVLIESTSLILRVAHLKANDVAFSDVMSCAENCISYCCDEELLSLHFSTALDAEDALSSMKERRYIGDAKSSVFAHMITGIEADQGSDWLEFLRMPKEDGFISLVWLMENRLPIVGLHMRGEAMDLHLPDGWIYQGSISERFNRLN